MSSNFRNISRRDFLKLSATGIVGAFLGGLAVPWIKRLQQPASNVAILKESSYHNNLVDTIRRGLDNYPHIQQQVRGGRVVLKPNMVDYYAGHPLSTHPAVIAAAIAAFRQIGAREVIVADGPAHNRDTEMVLEQSGIDGAVKDERVRFVDLNLDAISPVDLVSNYTGLSQLFFPHTILNADLVVSLPKLKTHHWAGTTLALKNLFGVIPGVKYGWPKNFLHWHGISNSIADIATAIRPGFAIIDGIIGMEGDGPLHGTAVDSGVIVMGDNLSAVDATATRLMGIYPENIEYLRLLLPYDGTINEARIRQLGEPLEAVQQDFEVVPHISFIKDEPPLWKQALLSGWE
ncbi:MAG: DUF362 domain-containing protein [Anaerolineales bacterium]